MAAPDSEREDEDDEEDALKNILSLFLPSSCRSYQAATSPQFASFKMGTSSLDKEDDDATRIYLSLGIKQSGKSIQSNPRVLSLISSLLERSVKKNEMLIETRKIKDAITIFHGLRAPDLTIRQYIERIFKYSCCSPSCFVLGHIYLDKFLESTDGHLTSLNVHRLLITCVMVAAKFIDDGFFNNAFYAKVGGVTTQELNRLEMKLLFSLDFRLQVSVETFDRTCFELSKESGFATPIERPFHACRLTESWPTKDESSFASRVARS